MTEKATNKCICGHSPFRHEGEMPYPCYDCDCKGYTMQFATHDEKADDRTTEKANGASELTA